MRLLWRMEVGCIDPERLVFVDEMGTHNPLAQFSSDAAYFGDVVPKSRLLENEAMFMSRVPIRPVPKETALVAKAAFPKGNLYMTST